MPRKGKAVCAVSKVVLVSLSSPWSNFRTCSRNLSQSMRAETQRPWITDVFMKRKYRAQIPLIPSLRNRKSLIMSMMRSSEVLPFRSKSLRFPELTHSSSGCLISIGIGHFNCDAETRAVFQPPNHSVRAMCLPLPALDRPDPSYSAAAAIDIQRQPRRHEQSRARICSSCLSDKVHSTLIKNRIVNLRQSLFAGALCEASEHDRRKVWI